MRVGGGRRGIISQVGLQHTDGSARSENLGGGLVGMVWSMGNALVGFLMGSYGVAMLWARADRCCGRWRCGLRSVMLGLGWRTRA